MGRGSAAVVRLGELMMTVAAEALRRYPALVVVYASAQPSALDGHALTAREHALTKPFMPEALVALVRQVIG